MECVNPAKPWREIQQSHQEDYMKFKKSLVLAALVATMAVLAVSQASAIGGSGLFLGGGSEGKPVSLQATSYPRTLTAERFDTGSYKGPLQVLKGTNGLKVDCEAVELGGGQLYGPYISFALGGPMGSSYSNCKMATPNYGVVNANVKMNSCMYEYSDFEAAAEGSASGEAAVRCLEENGGIKIQTIGCTASITEQTMGGSIGLVPLELSEETSVGVAMIASEIDYVVAGEFCTSLGFSPGSYSNGTFTHSMELHG